MVEKSGGGKGTKPSPHQSDMFNLLEHEKHLCSWNNTDKLKRKERHYENALTN